MNWYKGNIAQAVTEAKSSNKILLVFIEGSDAMSKEMTEIYNSPDVVEKLSSQLIIPLKLAANSVPYMQFCAIYPVLVIPSSYFIGRNGAPMEIVTGSLVSTEFCSRIDKLLETHQMIPRLQVDPTTVVSASNMPEVASTSAPVVPAVVSLSSPAVPSTSTGVPALSVDEEESVQMGTSVSSSNSESSQSLEEKVERAKALIEAQQQKKAQEEREKEKALELERRNTGKAIQQAQQTAKDNELKEWAKNRAKEKEEERLAREKVKAMIAQDRAERAARYQMTKEAEDAEKERKLQIQEEAKRAAINAAMNSNDARIQFRLPDGSHRTQTFSADATLEEARRYIKDEIRPPFSNFSLCTTFPRRHFTELNYAESLRDLQLAPSSVLLILPVQTVSSVREGSGFISNFFWMVLTPFLSVWNYIRSFIPGRPQQPSPPPATENPNPTPAAGTEKVDANREANMRRQESSFAKRDGNIFRINNQSDDEENNTWNGNSTQQM